MLETTSLLLSVSQSLFHTPPTLAGEQPVAPGPGSPAGMRAWRVSGPTPRSDTAARRRPDAGYRRWAASDANSLRSLFWSVMWPTIGAPFIFSTA